MTNFSFLRGASHPEEMVARAAELGLSGIGIADRNTLAGVVRAHLFARENKAAVAGMRVVPGARLAFMDGAPDVLAYPKDRAAYGRLCRILTAGNLRAPKGECHLRIDDLLEHGEGLQIVALPPTRPLPQGVRENAVFRRAMRGRIGGVARTFHESGSSESRAQHDPSPRPSPTRGEGGRPLLSRLREAFGSRLWIGASLTYGEDMRGGLARRAALARTLGAPLIATNDALMHAPERRALADVVACIRERHDARGRGAPDPGQCRAPSQERRARWRGSSPRRRRRSKRRSAFSTASPSASTNSRIAIRRNCAKAIATPQAALEAFAWEGARVRYPEGVPGADARGARARTRADRRARLRALFSHRARHRALRPHAKASSARGAARRRIRRSAICLGITEVDPARFDLLFERFISPERNEPPDIDVDFEHERREEVIQYIYERYGRERAGLAAAVITYRTRSAIRETAKVFGLSDDVIAALNGTAWGQTRQPLGEDRVRSAGLDPADPTLALALEMAEELIGFPRHLSQHSGGFVITRDRLDEIVAGDERGDGGPHDDRMGQGRSRRARPPQGRRAGARHADRAGERLRPSRSSITASA